MNVVSINVHPLELAGATVYRIPLQAPPRGIITKAQIIRFSGAKQDFTSTFYNSAAACPPGSASPVDPEVEAAGQLTIPMAAKNSDRYLDANGNDGGFFSTAIPYTNGDNEPIPANDPVTPPGGSLYLKIETSGIAAMVFGVFVMVNDVS